eukprot:TRINITY_DN3683_c0_g1_i3.p1 TRINITY_DN3683_c0_g1~~TRINITY_DN3683_c0_g1_i3.p1  ORF type:complete len:180 (+),score=44.54 TRINITY_DN3683_c0_g1_i3:1110-1649(+)
MQTNTNKRNTNANNTKTKTTNTIKTTKTKTKTKTNTNTNNTKTKTTTKKAKPHNQNNTNKQVNGKTNPNTNHKNIFFVPDSPQIRVGVPSSGCDRGVPESRDKGFLNVDHPHEDQEQNQNSHWNTDLAHRKLNSLFSFKPSYLPAKYGTVPAEISRSFSSPSLSPRSSKPVFLKSISSP